VRSSKDYSMPSIGKQYLLFLKYDASTHDFHLLTGYLFHGGHVYELDDLEHAEQNTSESKLIHALREHLENEQKFLSHVKAAKPTETKEVTKVRFPRVPALILLAVLCVLAASKFALGQYRKPGMGRVWFLGV
jgi:hypothetical protein